MDLLQTESVFSCEQLRRLVYFIKSYSYLYQTVNIRYFVDEIWQKIPPDWLRYLCTLTNTELNSFPFEKQQSSGCPKSLHNFVNDSRQCSLLLSFANNFGLYNETSEDSMLKKKDESVKQQPKMNLSIRAKKQHELERFVALIRDSCHQFRVNRVVDVGCGVGHLLSVLSNEFNVVGIECDELLCCSGKERYASVHYVNLKLTTNWANDPQIVDIFCGSENMNFRSAIVSLHGCGDLQTILQRCFVKLPYDRCPLLFTVGCCYHKMTTIEKPVIDWALSDRIRSLCSADWVLERSALRLACQEQLSRWPSSNEKREAHSLSFIRRSLLECVYEKRGMREKSTEHHSRRVNRSFGKLEDVGMVIAERLGVDGEERVQLITNYKNAHSKYESVFNTVEPFTLLQTLMQMPLESFVLIDRYLFLLEAGCSACCIPIFDSKISPRNFCLIASRQKKSAN
ncbi:unnamed protein product [Anisakis simplex]|uniref:Methyltranfer_dom domain-containing protein n=1 Tax=Anisakis simplex TaxID=6269 RepID=A0A0M3JVS8_ANISI|nr:unnamed protein product [Anisakis simplex]